LLGTEPCRPLDDFLGNCFFALHRRRAHAEARQVGEWMQERGLSTRRVLAREIAKRSMRKLSRK
jgi:hypothetical protein